MGFKLKKINGSASRNEKNDLLDSSVHDKLHNKVWILECYAHSHERILSMQKCARKHSYHSMKCSELQSLCCNDYKLSQNGVLTG